MGLTNIGFQKTPGRPVEITFGANLAIPANIPLVLLVGHGATGATGVNTVVNIDNVSDVGLATAEANAKFGVGSELAKMVIAAVAANADEGNSTFPPLQACVLASTDTSFAANAQTQIQRAKAQFVVSPYDFDTDVADRTILKNMATAMSAAQRVQNGQFGTFGIGFTRTADPANLDIVDTYNLIGCWLPDSAPVNSIAENAAACAAILAGNLAPFNPVDDVNVGGIPAPVSQADWPTVGAGLESEVALSKGYTPLWVKPTGDVAFVRSVTTRISTDGTGQVPVTAYYDVQDFQVLFFWRQTLFTRFSQPDFKQAKASSGAGQLLLSEVIRLAKQFEVQNMFQAVDKLAPQFQVQRNASDRSRFDVLTPVNVIPGLHVIASNVVATTQFDLITI